MSEVTKGWLDKKQAAEQVTPLQEMGDLTGKALALQSLIPRTHVKMPGMVVSSCNHSTEWTEAGGVLGLTGQPLSQINESMFSERDCLKK